MSTSNACNCCGRRFRSPKAIITDQGEMIVLSHLALEKEYNARKFQESEARSREALKQRLIDRADYLHLIPEHKRFNSLSLADELRYKSYGLIEKRRKEEEQGQNPGLSYQEQNPIGKPKSFAPETTQN